MDGKMEFGFKTKQGRRNVLCNCNIDSNRLPVSDLLAVEYVI